MVDKNTLWALSTTASSNTDIGGVTQAENVFFPPMVNDNLRERDAQIARFLADAGGINTVAGTANAITVDLASPLQALASGVFFTFKAASANTTATTLNAESLGVKAVRKIVGGTDVALVAGDILAGVRYEVVYDSTANAAAGAWILLNPSPTFATTPYPSGYIYGLRTSNNVTDATNDIDIAAGSARDIGDTANMVLASALTKRLDASWAVGTNQGGLDTGAVTNATYHVFIIKRPDTGVVDALFSLSATSPTMPANYTLKRRIGSIVRTGGAILRFTQFGDYFQVKTPAAIVVNENVSTTGGTYSLEGGMPSGLNFMARLWVQMAITATTVFLTITGAGQDDITPGSGALTIGNGTNATTSSQVGQVDILVAASVAAIFIRALGGTTAVYVTVSGWFDTRGKMGTDD